MTAPDLGRALRPDRRLVAALAVSTTAGYGVLFYAYGVLLAPMEQALGWRRSVLTGAFSTALLVAAVLSVPVGRWLDRHPPRALLTAGAAAATALVAAWGAVRHPVAYFAIWIGLGACMAILFYEPAFTILTKRLRGVARHRGVMTVTLVAGLASTIFGPLTAALEDGLGWRGAVFVLAALLGVLTVPAFAVALPRTVAALVPGDAPDGSGEEATAPLADAGTREAMASPQFAFLTAAYLLSAVTTFAIAVHLVPYLLAEGWPSGRAAATLGAVGLVQVLGRSVFTRLTARRAAGPLGTWVLGAKAVGVAALVLSPTIPGALVFVVVYGAANGLGTLTRATVVADLYGAAHYGSISAVVHSVTAVGGALAPFAAAAAIELVGAEEPVLWALVAIAAASAAANHVAVSGRLPARYPRSQRAARSRAL